MLRQQSEKITVLSKQIAAIPRGTIHECRQTLLGYEGTAGRIYFSTLSMLLPPEAEFKKRSRGRGAGAFNQMLNYGYGVLYRKGLNLCAKARLAPYIGVMHTDNYNRPTLVYDLVEPFRADVEQAVFFLFSKRKVHSESHFETSEQGFMLSKEGKQLLVGALYHVWRDSHSLNVEQLVSGLAKGLADWPVEGQNT